jgi:hypothetical protein
MLNYKISSSETLFLGKGYFSQNDIAYLEVVVACTRDSPRSAAKRQPINLSRNVRIKIYTTVILSVLYDLST